jgi:hypothetical protein
MGEIIRMLLMLMFAAVLASMSATSLGKPSPAVINRIERILSEKQCVKPLTRWWRHYAYWHEGRIDRRYVNVWFVEAGHDGLRAGRHITEPEPPMLDDSQFRLVSGKYEIATGRFVTLICSLNHPEKPANWNGR